MPAKTKRHDYVGAVAFVEHYYALAEYGKKTGTWRPLKEASVAKCEGCKKFWQPDPFRQIDYDSVSANPPSINDLIDGIAQVNVSMRDKTRTKMNGDLRLSWGDTVKCTFKKGNWTVVSIKSESY